MSKSTTINLRVDSEIKEQAEEILASMGLSFSEAVNLLLHQVRIQRALPFEVVAYSHIPKPETRDLIERIENGTADMAGPFETFNEYKQWVEADDDEINST